MRNGKRRLDFVVSGCSTFKTSSSFLLQPFGTSQFLGGRNWESLGQRVRLDLALLLSLRCQTEDFAACDFDTFSATLGTLC